MRQSQLFTKTRKHSPTDEVAKNAQLLIRAGFIHKEMAGVYSLLPLGLRTIKKIESIIREEMNALGGQEVELTALQDKQLWQKTDRWSDELVDVWFKTKLQSGGELGLSFTHEEPLTAIMAEYVSSYRDLPLSVYQFQTKFRNETRAKSGIMRGREFLMKDLYSFSRTQAEHDAFYEKAGVAYGKIFSRVGLGDKTYMTFASGGSFSKFSHEFQTLSDVGEDTIFVDEIKKVAINKEVYGDAVLESLGLNKDTLVEKKAIEVGNIFSLGTKFSESLKLSFKNESGTETPVIMGSYGIGLGRLMGVVVETLSDDAGIVWPASIAPFDVHLIRLGDSEGTMRQADELYESLKGSGVEVLYDDRGEQAGTKFADADLIGIPLRLVVSDKTVAAGQVEAKNRATGETIMWGEQDAHNGSVQEYILGLKKQLA
jgi:prolyl-tRNA synthetase